MAASIEHLQLSTFIKSVHQNLRDNAKTLGFEAAWQEHCADEGTLKKYAEAMHELAAEHWQKHCNEGSSALIRSRLTWVYNCCISYFFHKEILQRRSREREIANKINLNIPSHFEYDNVERLKMLDVGSCYNPLKVFKEFDVLPIDIAPAIKDVYKCDFTRVSIVDYKPNFEENKQITKIQQCSFDVVLFSLLLEYLPSPEQRLLCCSNAYKLLKTEGLLIIITPDSNHVGANAKFMKSWRYNLARIGFSRITYEKLPHIHCMAFRKSIRPEIVARWANLQSKEQLFPEMFIPQDFKATEMREDIDKLHLKSDDGICFLNELPNCIE